jgi:hypothetical protein
MASLPPDPRTLNLDQQLLEAAGELTLANADLMFLHLRDARELLRNCREDRVLAKATIVVASAALEANLAHLSAVGLEFSRVRPATYTTPETDFLAGYEDAIDERGNIVRRPQRQSLEQRLITVPTLLASAVGRRYVIPQRSSGIRKLKRTICRRDAIVHPRWDRYLSKAGWYEAAEAVDGVEVYLQSVHLQLHPYLVGYFGMLGTIPPGHHKNDGLEVGYRTRGKRRRAFELGSMTYVTVPDVILGEWLDANLMVQFALGSGVEGDSEGNLLSRAALILLYAMLDAELGIVAQWRMAEDITRFKEPEIHFLNERAIGLGHDGEVTVEEDRQSFKQRIRAIPRILARRVEGREIEINLGQQWGEQLIRGHELRNRLIHPPISNKVERVTLTELLAAAKAVKSYFAELATVAPEVFKVYGAIVDSFKLPADSEVENNLVAARKLREDSSYEGPITFPVDKVRQQIMSASVNADNSDDKSSLAS